MRQLFSPEGSVMLFITRLVNSVWLNILWFVFSIPIITAGASTTALFYVSLKMARNEEGNITSQFFQAFKDNFRFSTKVWLILLALGIVLGVDGYVLRGMFSENVFWTLNTAVFIVVVICYVVVMMYVFPLMARFENTVRRMLINSFFVGLRYLFCTILMAAIYFAMILIVIRFFTPAVIFGEGLCAYLCSYLLNPVLDSLAEKAEEHEAAE